MTTRGFAVIVASVAAVGVLAGCGGSSTTTVTVTTAATTTSSAAAVTAPIVTELQYVMTDLGYYTGPIDGVYGEQTTAAVTTMQQDLGVTADGIYGPETHAALKGKGASIVMEIQTVLAKYGYYTGPIDGAYGEQTKAAVEKLQQDLGVTVDGRFGPETATAFDEAVANGTIQPA